MWDFNQVIFQGRVTEDVKLKETPTGKKYCWFTVANNAPKKNQDGSFGEFSNYFNLVIFDDYAVRNEQKLWKGRRVLVIGKIIQNKWIDTNGGKHDELKIKVDRMIFDPLSKEEKEKHGILSSAEHNRIMDSGEDVFNDPATEVPVFEIKDVEKNVAVMSDDFGFEEIY